MEEQFVAKAPDFSGDGIAIWKGKTIKGDTFLKVKVLGGKAINCFKGKPKEDKLLD